MLKKETHKKLFIVTIFAIAMAFLESAVVVYLRKLYYPQGFNFPLKFAEPNLIATEVLREFSTIVILVFVGVLAGKTLYERFAYFLFSFGIWDVFYYLWLKIILDWPSSFLTFDVLFLIPWPWVAPVMVPIIISLDMIALALIIIKFQKRNIKINSKEWILLALGALIFLYTFLYDYGKLIIKSGLLSNFFNLVNNPAFRQIVSEHLPSVYNWFMFFVGEIFVLAATILFYLRARYKRNIAK